MQPDLFEETLEKKIYRMEKWIGRLHKELFFLKEIYQLKQRSKSKEEKKDVQTDLFAS